MEGVNETIGAVGKTGTQAEHLHFVVRRGLQRNPTGKPPRFKGSDKTQDITIDPLLFLLH